MNKLSLWKHDELLEEHNNVSNVNFSDGNLSFTDEEGDNELMGLNPEVIVCLHSDEDGLNKENYKEYELKRENTLEEDEKIKDLENKIEDLTKLIEAMSLNIKQK